ncbi:MAG: glycoside hydrolase family 31 protein [Clostridia bacterium]
MTIAMLENECWWGGAAHSGVRMPFDAQSEFTIDLRRSALGNQSTPFFLSSKGRYLWCAHGFAIRFSKGTITVDAPVELYDRGGGLPDAYRAAMRKHFPPTGIVPEMLFFSRAQYNTWAELVYDQCESEVLRYARQWVAEGYEPGVLMIDDTWQTDYGVWRFHPERFPHPKDMAEQLHALGYRLMLWICPYVSADSAEFRELEALPGALVRDERNKPAIIRWWNGYSAALDFRSEAARAWMDGALHGLMDTCGVDGFKFDGGSIDYYIDFLNPPDCLPEELSAAWSAYALRYRFEEVKDTFGASGQPYIQRLRDKRHAWSGGDGLDSIVPDALALGLTGHYYLCPDMIGGGEWTSFVPGAELSEELIVRFAQASALFPMMQFSVAPWRVLSAENAALVREAERLHRRFAALIEQLVRKAAMEGEPPLAPLCYHDPAGGHERVTDQFMLGRDLLVAPVLAQGATEREVRFPQGKWQDEDGNCYTGACSAKVNAPLSRLPWFWRVG